MADVTGAVHHKFSGKDYTLRLTWGVLGKLQDKHGNNLGGLLDGQIEGVPPFGLLIDVVSGALQKGMSMDQAEADDLADDMITADNSLVEKIMNAAFPDVDGDAGNAKAPKAKA